jgi:tRNA-dihydrouridine synthase 1
MSGIPLPIAPVGAQLRVCWPESTDPERKCTIIHIATCDKIKHGSWYKYSLQFRDDGSCVETRLAHLTFRMKKLPTASSTASNSAGAGGGRTREEDEHDGHSNAAAPKKTKLKHEYENDTLISKPTHTVKKATLVVSPISHIMKRAGKVPWRIPTHKYICAPMVGGSELAFRLLCRRYGCDLAYTPMISSARFAVDEEYRKQEFQTTAEDRPLVAHFSANNPAQLLAAARLVEDRCDAIDLNLGCPQRVAFVGHYGSFLLDDADRPLVLSMVRTLADALSIPIFVKIRLLTTIKETIELCKQLEHAGAALIAIHARYRVNLTNREGAGARDGPAFLDQVAEVRRHMSPDTLLITNGNVRVHGDIAANLALTGAQGVMSAEGLLDNPAIFSPSMHDKDRLDLATEYLDLVDRYPVKMKSVVFHVRRIARDALTAFQLMEDCCACDSAQAVRLVIEQAKGHRDRGDYEFDPLKQIKAQKALERRKLEEGKRKRYEERMTRKAKREGKEDLSFYLSQGAENPTVESLRILRSMSKEDAFEVWKAKHSQHCYDYHFNADKCKRDRTCAFLHAEPMFDDGVADVFG